MKNVTRREFMKSTAAGALGIAAAGLLGACSAGPASTMAAAEPSLDTSMGETAGPETAAATEPATAAETAGASEIAAGAANGPAAIDTAALGITAAELEGSVAEIGAITDFVEEHAYDVIVVGAGTTGIPAALAAAEAGASVGVLQKQAMVFAQGNLAAAVDPSQSDEIGTAQYVHELHSIYDHRGNIKLHRIYAQRSPEALAWFEEKLKEVEFTNYKESDSKLHTYDDGVCFLKGRLFPGQMIEPMTALAPYAEQKGVEFFYETPAVQLIREQGAVVGVIGKSPAGYIKFTAKKGVILATGDYQNNDAMVSRYTPDAEMYERKQTGKTGDGHLIGMLAGARMEPGTHCKMVHASGAGVLREEPLLALNMNGERFMYEDIEYGDRNTVLRDQPLNQMVSLFDANYAEYVYGWGSDPTVPTVANASEEKLASFVENGTVLKADTLEELLAAAGLPVETGKASVERYNELCAMGKDLDFGKSSKYMKPVDTAPFYAQVRKFQISAIPAGLLVDENSQCLDADREPIPGLFAAGNCSGCFYGDNDYSLSTMGLSIGRCITFGYLAGQYVAGL